jgi:predicted Zn-dependent protease
MSPIVRRAPTLKAAVLLLPMLLAGCTTLVGDSNISVSETGQMEQAPAVPEGTEPDDAVIGRREHPRIIAAFGGVYSDREAEIMVARIVGRLLAAADQADLPFTVTILDSAEVNAFALPGGYIYVTRGILALANDSSELAAVLAHEISHVVLRHARARSDRTRTTQIVDRVITDVFRQDPATVASNTQQSMAAFSQQQELEADREGIKIAGRAGYDPRAAARFLGVMQRFAQFAAGQNDVGEDFLSSHPSTPDRIQKAVETARTLFGDNATGEADRAGYMRAVDGLTFGDSPQQGVINGRRFIHPGLKLTFTVPEGYTLQNSQSAVVGVAGDGEAVRFDSATVAPDVSLADYLKSGWIAGLQANTIRSEVINGIETASGLAATDQWRFRVSVMRLDGVVYRFIFAAKTDDARFMQGADATLRSFRRTEPADLDGVRQVRVKTVVAAQGDTAESLARQMRSLERGEELFYIINNLYPGDPLTVGAGYKIVAAR